MADLNPEYLTALYHLVNTSPFPSHLPMRVVEVHSERSVVELEVATCHLQPFGIVHGGVLATLIDTATFWAGFGGIPESAGLVNVDLKLNYLEAVSSGLLRAEGRLLRAGRSVVYAEASVRSAPGGLVAHGTSTMMVLPGKSLPLKVAKFLSE